MIKWLNKEYTIKTKIWKIIVEIILSSILFTYALYVFVENCNDEIIKVLTLVKTEDNILNLSLLVFPIVLIITSIFRIAYYTCTHVETGKKNKK